MFERNISQVRTKSPFCSAQVQEWQCAAIYSGFLTAVENAANQKIVCRLVCSPLASKLRGLMNETALHVVVPQSARI